MAALPRTAARPRRRALAAAVVLAAGLTTGLTPVLAAPAGLVAAPAHEQAYPRQAVLTEPADDQGDASLKLGLASYRQILQRLNAAQASSDRVSAEVIGTTSGGRQVVLVTLTAPETAAQAGQQTKMRERIADQPQQAAGDRGLARKYKLPVFLNANIHGNEWEGTDAALRLIEDYATSQDPEVVRTLETTRLHLVVTMNPDGRHDNTRKNAAGFDLNRDFITATQPETIAVRDALVRTQPALLVDLHGYVNGTLVEPTTPPHGENYEYDLFVKHAYPNALGMEAAINGLGFGNADGVEPVQIPLRDWAEGWDDWPPIFTPQYAALHGAVAHTVEVPLRVNNSAYQQPEAELRRRSAINTDIAHAAMTSSIRYAVAHRDALLADQIEGFRRGVAGEPQRAVQDGLFGVIGPEDVYTADFPRAYVIRTDEAQRSPAAAARLVAHLVANDVDVTRMTRPATIDGQAYPAGTYVVDLHQAKRGMARTILGAGSDISERVDAMYDISGWSHGLLWGADVVTVPAGSPLRVVGKQVTAPAPAGSLAGSATGWVLRLDDPADVAALGALRAAGAQLEWLADGTVLVPAEDGRAARAVVDSHGARLVAAPEDAEGTVLTELRIGAAATPEELWALGEMGLTVEPVTSRSLNEGLDLSDLDALYVSSGLQWRDLDRDARAELEAFVAEGGGLVARGARAAALNEQLGVVEATAVAGRSDANGVVAVDNDPASPIASGATDHTFVYSPVWFTDLGAEVTVDQRYGEDPVVSGHWRPDARGVGGPADAAGQPVIVHGTDEETGARGVLIGSEPLFRAHPKGQYPLVARALIWASLDG
ncbi:M14 family zinc carboxypeptidase [Ornithinimicrobium panacihumi]|uniref:M14 family zinc carboxypeptidase n=1 Tax=Ornithinimicrobium panacihumi TaxID=2008449 RepID=UPI003F8A7F43